MQAEQAYASELDDVQGGPKSKRLYQIITEAYQILLIPAKEISFLRQNKVSIKHYNIIRL